MSAEQPEKEPEPFALLDCNLVRYAIGRSCSNLRELLDAIQVVPDIVLDHHMRRCVLADHFELNEFPNDFARWSWDALGDRVLAEQLSLVDPYQHPDSAELRKALTEIIEARLWGNDRVPWCRPGLELHLTGSKLVAYDTGERYSTLPALAEVFHQISARSLFYHVHEAHVRRADRSDDFSAWLETLGADPALVAQLRGVDFYFLNLSQLRHEFLEIFGRFLHHPTVLVRGAA